MADGEAELSGPDLSVGVSTGSIESGSMLLGHANGEAVLLARIGDDFTAIGATCTHYGGPLAEGVMDGDTVRCPWHHACFSLRTGEALRAPALSPVACWKVEQRDGKVVVTGKEERDPLAPTYPMQHSATPASSAQPGNVVIVGAGAAGSAAAEMLRRCGYTGKVTMVDQEPGSPYDRPNLSKDYLAGNAPEEWIPLRPDGFYGEHGIELIRDTVVSIDPAGRQVVLSSHPPIHFEALLLATGADPVRLKMPGSDGPQVHYLRSLEDSRALIAAAADARRAVVIGSSFIGLEVAASLRSRGLEVTVVAPEAVPLERVMGHDIGSAVRALHEQRGVVFLLGHQAGSIEPDAVVLEDGTRVPADLVVIGVGVRPRLSLAQDAGLEMDRGVVVNGLLETSAPGIYAAGDIARWPDPHSGENIRVEHWVVAQRMGQTAARNILGAGERFEAVPFFWSAHYDMSINYVGHAEKPDNVSVNGSAADNDVTVRFEREGGLSALATIFRDQESLATEIAMERGGN